MSKSAQSPLTVSALGLSPESIFGISSDPSVRELGEGYSSGVFEVASLATILRIGQAQSLGEAEHSLRQAEQGSKLIRFHLGDLVVSSSFSVQRNEETGRFHVVTMTGIASGEPISELDADQAERASIIRPLLRKSLSMYQLTEGEIPDISRAEEGYYDPTRSPHILVSGSGRVKLIHPTFREKQQRTFSGRMTNSLIAAGARRALRRVER